MPSPRNSALERNFAPSESPKALSTPYPQQHEKLTSNVPRRLDNAQASIVAASNRSDVLSDEKIKLTSDHQQSLSDLRRCQEELSTSRSTAESRSQELHRLRSELQEARTSSEQMCVLSLSHTSW